MMDLVVDILRNLSNSQKEGFIMQLDNRFKTQEGILS